MEDKTLCDAEDQTTKANQFCLIEVQKFRESPFLLEVADTVVASVSALNIIGESLKSDENTSGADIRTKPLKPT